MSNQDLSKAWLTEPEGTRVTSSGLKSVELGISQPLGSERWPQISPSTPLDFKVWHQIAATKPWGWLIFVLSDFENCGHIFEKKKNKNKRTNKKKVITSAHLLHSELPLYELPALQVTFFAYLCWRFRDNCSRFSVWDKKYDDVNQSCVFLIVKPTFEWQSLPEREAPAAVLSISGGEKQTKKKAKCGAPLHQTNCFLV